MVKDNFLGGLTPFLGSFWQSRQFEIVVVKEIPRSDFSGKTKWHAWWDLVLLPSSICSMVKKKCCCLLKISTFMTQIIGSWYKNIDRGFFHYVGESASLESPACFMIKFGLFPPTQIVNHGDEVHIELVKSKKASQRAYAKAKNERCSLVPSQLWT